MLSTSVGTQSGVNFEARPIELYFDNEILRNRFRISTSYPARIKILSWESSHDLSWEKKINKRKSLHFGDKQRGMNLCHYSGPFGKMVPNCCNQEVGVYISFSHPYTVRWIFCRISLNPWNTYKNRPCQSFLFTSFEFVRFVTRKTIFACQIIPVYCISNDYHLVCHFRYPPRPWINFLVLRISLSTLPRHWKFLSSGPTFIVRDTILSHDFRVEFCRITWRQRYVEVRISW